jgi:hypothetical protein
MVGYAGKVFAVRTSSWHVYCPKGRVEVIPCVLVNFHLVGERNLGELILPQDSEPGFEAEKRIGAFLQKTRPKGLEKS